LLRHKRWGRYYGDGINKDCYEEERESYFNYGCDTKDVMIPDGKGQAEYIASRCGEVKILKIKGESEHAGTTTNKKNGSL
jgi:hypothetical protein